MAALRALPARLRSGAATVAGVLSGTSADGIDVALVRFAPSAQPAPPDAPPASDLDAGPDVGTPGLVVFATLPFGPDLAARVRAALDGEPLDARAVALLDRDLGRAFGAAARTLADERGEGLDLVASHGQTVWHHDGVEASGPATLQLGEGDHVATAAGCPAATDFRQADVAAGGEGAPLSALVDPLLFAGRADGLAVLNLGGIGNLGFPGVPDAPAFDTGPAGALLDGLARRLLGRSRDEGGRVAATGTADPALVERVLSHPFFAQAPPRSTGRDTFGEAWVEGVVRAAGPGRPAADLLATGVAVVAEAVARGLREHAPPRAGRPGGPGRIGRLAVCGGGVHHGPLLAALEQRTGLPTVSTAELGVDPDAREGLVFAVLGARCALGVPSTAPAVTGARPGRVLGKLCHAP